MIRSLTILTALATACTDTSPSPPGAPCTKDTDCQSDLSCLDVAQINGTTCTVVGRECSITCQGTPVCTSQLGPTFMCFAGCGTTMSCGEVDHP